MRKGAAILISFLLSIIFITSCIKLPIGNKKPPNTSEDKKSKEDKNDNKSNKEKYNPSSKIVIKPIKGDFNKKGIVSTVNLDLSKLIKLDPGRLSKIGYLGGITGSNKSQFALTIKDKNMKVLEHIGHGYDVFDNYASAEFVKPMILDLEKLLADGKIFRKNMPSSSYKEVSTEDARSYSKEVATSVGLSGSYLFFSGSVKSNFNNSHLEESNHYFSTIFYTIKLYELYIDPSTNLNSYIKKDVSDFIETGNAFDIFNIYGTHVLKSLVAGGRFDYSTSINKKHVKDINEFSTSVKASFNAGFASAGVMVNNSTTTVSEEFKTNSDTKIFTYGGNGIDGRSMGVDPNALKEWTQSVTNNPSISDFGQNALNVPIWEFCKTQERKNYLKQEFEKYAITKMKLIPSGMAINGLRLNFISGSDTILPEFTDDSGQWHVLSNIAAGASSPYDGFTMLYCRYGMINDTENPPIAEILLENETQGENALEYYNSKYSNDSSARLFGLNGTTNIEGSNLGIPINQPFAEKAGAHRIRLYYVTSSSAKPIRSIVTKYKNPKGETYYIPPVEEGKKYLPILDKTSQREGKQIPQNTGEGAKTSYILKKGDPFYIGGFINAPIIIHTNHYIEYSYD